jgi:hypothetical protein
VISAARRAFTTFEIVIALVIIAILLMIAIPQFTRPSLATVSAPDSIVATGSSGPIAIRVADMRGRPQRGVTVRFEVAGQGSVTPQEVATDSSGVAKATWRASPDSGAFRVTATAAGRSRPELVLRTRVRTASATPSTTTP